MTPLTPSHIYYAELRVLNTAAHAAWKTARLNGYPDAVALGRVARVIARMVDACAPERIGGVE